MTRSRGYGSFAVLLVAVAACTPTVEIATEEPITINVNVNIKHEILIKVDDEVAEILDEDSGLF